MVRGVNRQIIEVQETGSLYYEKAYLVVRPAFADAQVQALEREAKRVLREMGAPCSAKRGSWWLGLRFLCSAALGAGVAAGCLLLF